MFIVRGGEKDEKIEVFEISQDVARQEVMKILTEYGIVYEDTKAAELRSDMLFLRTLRLNAEQGRATAIAAIVKAVTAGIIALIVIGFYQWIKQEVAK